MKKNIFKRIASVVVATALVVSAIVVPNTKAIAADSMYVYGTFNNWNGADTLTSEDGITYTGDIALLEGNDNLYIEAEQGIWASCVSISGATSSDVSCGVWDDGGTSKVWVTAAAGTYTLTYNTETTALTIALKSVSTTTYTYEYYVAGEEALEAELWNNIDASTYGAKGKMTADGTVWTYTADTTSAFDGSAGYNIIKIGTPDDGGNKTIAWINAGDNAAFACDYVGKGTLTITFDEEAVTSSASFEAVKIDTVGVQANVAGNKLAFVTLVDVDLLADVKEAGIILTKGMVSSLTINDVEDENVYKCPTSYVTTDSDAGATEDYYAFRTIINGPEASDVYTAVPYMVLNDGTIIYGDACSKSLAEVMQ